MVKAIYSEHSAVAFCLGDPLKDGMMPSFSYHPWNVQKLVDQIEQNTVSLPDIQRPFVWSNPKVRDLIDSMYRGFPVGELMFWANRNEDQSRLIGTGTQSASFKIIDGQQRLTSLFAVFTGQKVWREDYSQEQIKIAFNPISERFDVPTPALLGSPSWINDITSVMTDPFSARHTFLERYRTSLGNNEFVDDRLIESRINRLYDLRNYLFQVVQIEEDVSRETVADIFVRINSEGVSLASADFILTWLSVFWEEGRQLLEEFARNSRFQPAVASQLFNSTIPWTAQNSYITLDAGQVLRVVVAFGLSRGKMQNAYNALRGRNPQTREIEPELRVAELTKLKNGQIHVLNRSNWDEYLRVLERSGIRTREMVTSSYCVLYTYVLWLKGRVEFEVSISQLREVMARWLFIAQLTRRYTGSSESAIQEDLDVLNEIREKTPQNFVDVLSRMIERAVSGDWWSIQLVDDLRTSSTKSPAFVGYLAALNILGSEVLLSNMKVSDWMNPGRRSIRGIEKHHLFPQGYLKNVLGIRSVKKTNQVANYALVEWSTNGEISDSKPSEYWPAQLSEKGIIGAQLMNQCHHHALPENWTEMEFEGFLDSRRKLMAKVTLEGFRKLSDASYLPDFHPESALSRSILQPMRSIPDLIERGLLHIGQVLIPLDPEEIVRAEIADDFSIRVGDHSYSSLDRAARERIADTADGWEFWGIDNGDGEVVSLSQLAG